MDHVPHPDQEPLVSRPARDKHLGIDEQAERNLTSAQEPSGQGSDIPGFGVPSPDNKQAKLAPRNLREARQASEIEPDGSMTEEQRRQLEQNIVPHENYP